MVRSHGRRAGTGNVDDIESESVTVSGSLTVPEVASASDTDGNIWIVQ